MGVLFGIVNLMKTTWNLGLLYKSPTDPAIEQDILAFEKACESFEKKWKKPIKFFESPKNLLSALKDYEKMDEIKSPLVYFYLAKDIDSANKVYEANINKISDRVTKSGNKIVFFSLTLASLSKEFQKKILADKSFAHFHYYLYQIFKNAKYRLTEPEEKILRLTSAPAGDMWVSGQEKLLSSKTIKWEGKNISIGEATNIIRELPLNKARFLHKELMMLLKSVSDFAESEINAIYTDKKISDELRGYAKPYSATILGYENDEKSIETLVKSVTDHFNIAHKFFKVKAKMLKQKKLLYADRAVGVGKSVKAVTFKESIDMLKDCYTKLGGNYNKILDSYLEKGQIDVMPRKGKKGGAYCWSNVNCPTYVLLNHTESMDSYMTLAHEMGHAMHAEFSKSQPLLYQGHVISVAEVASTLFENFAFEEIWEKLSDKEKIIALHDRISDDVQTIFRQIACFNFELELHNEIRDKGFVSKEDIAKMLSKHMHSYLGPVFEMKEYDGYQFVSWSHIRRFFYVYSYAYGQIISKALYLKYKEDKDYLKKIEEFLSAGQSKSPEDIFLSIGIDTRKPEFFVAGLKSIEADIMKLEKLVNKK
jgi:oligoendopeptidase F